MKLAAVHAIADLAKEPVPEIVNLAYNKKNITFGKEYIIPKPLDPRLITTVAPAVARAAMESGVAQVREMNWSAYSEELSKRLGRDIDKTGVEGPARRCRSGERLRGVR